MTESKLKEIIRSIVKEEVTRVVPTLVAKTVTEVFLRKIVTESVSSTQRSLDEEVEEEYAVAQPVRAYNPALDVPVQKKTIKGLEGMADLFEGTSPVKSGKSNDNFGETQRMFGEEGVPLSALKGMGIKLPGISGPPVTPQKASRQEAADEDRAALLERRRQMLESIIHDSGV